MNTCTICGMRIVRNDYFERHMKKHEESPKVEEPTAEAKVEEPVAVLEVTKPNAIEEPQVGPIVAAHEEVAEPVKEVVPEVKSDKIEIHFSKPVEIYINGKAYLGKNIVAPDVYIASEIVRIAREAYGRNILV